MGRRQTDSQLGRYALFVLFVMGMVSCLLAYLCFSAVFRPGADPLGPNTGENLESEEKKDDEDCCRGIEHLELWGDTVKWGSNFKLNSSKECCMACKGMCGENGKCLCNSWVFCGDKQACGSHFGECWLKKQKDIFEPDQKESGNQVMWTSGLVFGEGEGIVAMRTEHGTLHIKLLPDCAPHSVFFILELLTSRYCVGCNIYRAEGRWRLWDIEGNHIKHASYGPPYALIQGTFGANDANFKGIPTEACPSLRRGSVAWIGSGPEFFISLANHNEWKNAYTEFGIVLPEDMKIAENIAQLPTKPEMWNDVKVAVLENPVSFHLQRIKTTNSNGS